MFAKLAWKAYKIQYLAQCAVMKEMLESALNKTRSSRKRRVLYALYNLNKIMLTNMLKTQNFKDWYKFCTDNKYRMVYINAVEVIQSQIESKIYSLGTSNQADY